MRLSNGDLSNDLEWPITRSQDHDIFEVEYLIDKVTIAHTNRKSYVRMVPFLFGDLDWPVNASRGFVSISWALCMLSCRSIDDDDDDDDVDEPKKWRQCY